MTRRITGLKALEQLKSALRKKCIGKYCATEDYTGNNKYVVHCHSPDHDVLERKKQEIITKVSTAVERWAVSQFPEYGVISVPTCHRKQDAGEDRLEIELKIKKYPELEKFQHKVDVINFEMDAALKSIDDWYIAALKAATSGEDQPSPPEF
jgi:hypothetical protein